MEHKTRWLKESARSDGTEHWRPTRWSEPSASKLLIGVVHLGALPGSPAYHHDRDVRGEARHDATQLLEGGFDGFIVENFGDRPFYKDHVDAAVVAEMAIIAHELRSVGDSFETRPWIGINVLRNDAMSALSIANAADADFIRVNVHTGIQYTDQGAIEGRAAETLRRSRELEAGVDIIADVAVKHATPPYGFDLATAAKDCAYRGFARGLIVTGSGTGEATDLDDLQIVRDAVPDRQLFVGSGVTIDNVNETLAIADAVIVGTALKEDGDVDRPVSLDRVRAFVEKARG